MLTFLIQTGMQTDEVRFLQQGIQITELNPLCHDLFLVCIRVICQYAVLEAIFHNLCKACADMTAADDTACLSAQLKSHDFLTIPVPVALMHLVIGCNHVFRYCHKQCSSLFCDSIQFHIVLDMGYIHTVLFRAFQINVIETDAMTGDQLHITIVGKECFIKGWIIA